MSKALTPKEALRAWADSSKVSPAGFGRKMGYSYNHAYQLLRGEAEVTIEMLGRFVVAYGIEAARQIAAAFTEYADLDGAVVVQLPTTLRPRSGRRGLARKAGGKTLGEIEGVSRDVKVEG